MKIAFQYVIRSMAVAALVLGLAAPAVAQNAGSITLGWVKSTANLAAFIAPELAEEYGLTIQSENFNNAQDITTALVNGQLDVGLLTPIHLIRAVESDFGLVQVSGNTRGNTGIVISSEYGVGENEWDKLKEVLKDKKLRVASSRGSINETLAIAEFHQHGIDIDEDLEWVNIPSFAQHPQALRSGEFDMIVTLEPLAAMSQEEGFGTLLSHPYSSVAGDLNTNYVMRKDFIENNPEKVAAFVKTIVEAEKRLDADMDYNVQTGVRLTGLPENVVRRALSNNRYNPRNDVDKMQALAKLAYERGFIQRDVADELPQWVDDTFLEQAGVK